MSTFTEREAAEKWCPHSSAQRGCIGQRCMAWRWDGASMRRKVRLADDAMAVAEPARPATVPSSWLWVPHEDGEPACWTEGDEEYYAHYRGYCSFAGVPRA